jgi:fatty-acyl-CoA synthase
MFVNAFDVLGQCRSRGKLESPSTRRSALLARFPSWQALTISGLFDLIANEFPDRPVVLTPDRQITYREAQAISREWASGLIGLGLEPGQHVAVVMANYPEFPIMKLAIIRAGCVSVPINYLLQYDEMRYVVEQSKSKILVGMSEFRDRDYASDFIRLRQDIPDLEHIFVLPQSDRQASDFPAIVDLGGFATAQSDAELLQREANMEGSAVSDIVYTSGTTGRPKGAILTHDMVLRAAFSSALTRSFEDGRRILFALPMYHVFGYVECWVAALFVGGAIIPQAIFDPDEMLELAEQLGATDMICVPVMTQALIEQARKRGFKSDTLLSVFNSGGVNIPSVWTDIRDALGATEIHTAYGMTETTASAMCTWTEDDDEILLDTNGRYKFAGPAGDEAIGGLVAQYRVVDPETGQELPFDCDGELQVRGPAVTQGYYCKPEETQAAFTADSWFRSGDIGRLSEDGYIKMTGRLKESYRCGGEMVMPREIEDLLSSYPGISQVFAVGIPDPKMGEVGCLCIVPAAGAKVVIEEIIAYCAARLARFKVPKYAVLLRSEDVALTATGRPQKFRLTELAIEKLGLTSPT